jgi:hypothetical protein
MRDPESRIYLKDDEIRRVFNCEPAEDHFLHSPLARRWVTAGLIPSYKWRSTDELIAERVPFVSYPDEWCDAQLHDAAAHTLQLQSEAVEAGFDLKDASAWNVVFRGTEPLFCDLGSFQPLQHHIWWAGGQFARQFLVPLWLALEGRLYSHQCFTIWRDGVPSPESRRLLGMARFLTRYWPLVAEAREVQRPTAPLPVAPRVQTDSAEFAILKRQRRWLHTSLRWMLDGLNPRPHKAGGPWVDYTMRRDHYESSALDTKRRTVAEWISRIQPKWVADFGANTGEFSFLAASVGAKVVSLDSDHDSVRRIFRERPPGQAKRIHPIVATLDDIRAGRGWEGNEFAGLSSRLNGRFDVVMMLALIHHLAVAASIPLMEIAAFAARCTRRFLIVELINSLDPQLNLLAQRYGRSIEEFSTERQRSAFVEAGFVIESEVDLAPACRRLLLMRR